MRTTRILSGLTVLSLLAIAPRVQAAAEGGSEGSRILEGLRTLFIGFEFKWGNLQDPMKSKMPTEEVVGVDKEPKPIADLRLKMADFNRIAAARDVSSRKERLLAVHNECNEIKQRALRAATTKEQKLQVQVWEDQRKQTLEGVSTGGLLDALTRLEEAEKECKAAKPLFEEGRFQDALAKILVARGKLSEDIPARLEGKQVHIQTYHRLNREISDLEKKLRIRLEFPYDVFKIQGVIMAPNGAVVIIGPKSYEKGEPLDDLDARLKGAWIEDATLNQVTVMYRGEKIIVQVAGGGP